MNKEDSRPMYVLCQQSLFELSCGQFIIEVLHFRYVYFYKLGLVYVNEFDCTVNSEYSFKCANIESFHL